MDDLTVGSKDVAEHGSQVFILCELIHHVGQGAGSVAEEGRDTIGQTSAHQELGKRDRYELQQDHEPHTIPNFLMGTLRNRVKHSQWSSV